MIIAGIVLYNPDIYRLKENLDSIVRQVEDVILIDNNSNNIKKVENLTSNYSNVFIIKNDINKGIATALNQIISYASNKKYKWVITLDQDSVCSKNLINIYGEFLNINNIGMMTCNIVDRNFSLESNNFTKNPYIYVDDCITSGCLTNIAACIDVGGFDESLFIDYVDFDMCTTMLEHGYKIIKINYDGLLHEVGSAFTKKICGRTEVIYNHSAFRKYYIARNGIYYLRKHKASFSLKHYVHRYLRVYEEILFILVYENNKFEKLKAGIKGIIDGHKMKINIS